MKVAWIVIGLGAVLLGVGVGVACGPEQKYCYLQHESCTQAEIAKEQADKDRMNAQKDGGGGLGDSAVVVETGP